MGWLSRWFGAEQGFQTSSGATGVPATHDGTTTGAVRSPQAAERPPFLCWLLAADQAQLELSATEQQALDLVDQLLALPALPADLLPRAANVVPQLIAMLREDDLPVSALAGRIAKDPTTAAEVLRMAGSAFYSNQGPVQDLPQAIQRLGVEGLQMAISRVLLRPMYQARPGSLSGQVAPRLWAHADVLSRHCTRSARDVGASGFDGYLTGLLYDTGWTVMFHALQKAGLTGWRSISVAGSAAMEVRAHHLFGKAAAPWQITPAFTAFAVDARGTDLAHSGDPMAAALRAAQPACMDELRSTA
jgi:hypothetical protein